MHSFDGHQNQLQYQQYACIQKEWDDTQELESHDQGNLECLLKEDIFQFGDTYWQLEDQLWFYSYHHSWTQQTRWVTLQPILYGMPLEQRDSAGLDYLHDKSCSFQEHEQLLTPYNVQQL